MRSTADGGVGLPDPHTGKRCAAALTELLERGRLDTAEQLARRLSAAYPRWKYAEVMRDLFDCLPPADGSQPAFADDLKKEVQVVRRDGADRVLLLFCGFDHKMGLSLSAIHRWFGRLPANLIYMRDFRSLFYLAGLPSLGSDADATIVALSNIITALDGRRIFCLGCSGGVFAALYYGLALGAEAVLALAGPTNLTAEFNAHLRSARRVARLQTEVPRLPKIDLRQSYAVAKHPPQVLITYDQNNWDDRLHAEYLAGLPSVRLEAVEGGGFHAIVAELIIRRLFDERLDWLMGR